jgi:nicotinamide riboside transporter PnuC
MNELLGLMCGVIAVAGVVLNNYRMRSCFWLWLVSNAISAGLHVDAGLYSLAARDGVFLILAVHGLRQWKNCRLNGTTD